MGCDNPDKFGWDRILEIIERDRVCGFRLIDASRIEAITSELSRRDNGSIPRTFFLRTVKRHLPYPGSFCSERCLRDMRHGLREPTRKAIGWDGFKP